MTAGIADSATFSTLTKALKATGLDATLGNKDELTIFAPTDEAFGKLPPETLTKLMRPENKEKLRMLLLFHVVAGRKLVVDLIDSEVKSVNGEKLKVAVSAEKIEVSGAKFFSADVIANNGVMHSIGKVQELLLSEGPVQRDGTENLAAILTREFLGSIYERVGQLGVLVVDRHAAAEIPTNRLRRTPKIGPVAKL